MKKIFLFVAFVMAVSVANAWHKNCGAGVVALAVKNLTPEAKAVVEKHLGATYEDDVRHLYLLEWKKKADFSKEIHYLHLDKDFQPLSVEGDDAYAALEKALAVVRAHKTHSAAEVKNADYYVRMMVAWYFATALTKQYDAALPYIKEKKLERWTHNKAIQKAIESDRISPLTKQYLKTLKRR